MSPGGGGSLNVEEFFQKLLELAQQLNEEEKRGISEGLSEEELALRHRRYRMLLLLSVEVGPSWPVPAVVRVLDG